MNKYLEKVAELIEKVSATRYVKEMMKKDPIPPIIGSFLDKGSSRRLEAVTKGMQRLGGYETGKLMRPLIMENSRQATPAWMRFQAHKAVDLDRKLAGRKPTTKYRPLSSELLANHQPIKGIDYRTRLYLDDLNHGNRTQRFNSRAPLRDTETKRDLRGSHHR